MASKTEIYRRDKPKIERFLGEFGMRLNGVQPSDRRVLKGRVITIDAPLIGTRVLV